MQKVAEEEGDVPEEEGAAEMAEFDEEATPSIGTSGSINNKAVTSEPSPAVSSGSLLLAKNNRAMTDDAIDNMETGQRQDRRDNSAMEEDASNDNERESGRGRRVADEWAVLPGGEEKDEEVGDDGGVLGGAPNEGDDDGGGSDNASPAAVITVEECLKQRNPLHYACQQGASLEVIKYLVEEADGDKGKELLGKADRYDGRYPLHYACDGGASLEVIKYLVEEADGDKGKEPLGKADTWGMYPLHYVCEKGASIDTIKFLVEAGGDKGKEVLCKQDQWGRCPLHWACQKGASIEVIKYLVEEADGGKGKEPLGKADHNGYYPIHLACEEGASIDTIKYLVEAGGDKGKEVLGKADQYGKCPLHYVCSEGASHDVIKYLVEEADGDKGKELLGKADTWGMYPLHYVCEKGASIDTIKFLVEAGGDKGKEVLCKQDQWGRCPLHWACQKGASVDTIKYLVEAGGDKGKEVLGKVDQYGKCLLHYVCEKGASLDTIKCLVEAGGDKGKEVLGKADNDGRCPLHCACGGGASIEVIKYLIQKNPGSLQYKDKSGRTALDYIMDNNALKEPLLHWVQEFLAKKNNQAMSDDPMIDSMDAGERQDRGDDSAMEEDVSNDNEREGGRGRRVMGADELAMLPGGEEKDEKVGDDGGVLGGATNDGGGGGASPAANRVITVEECLKQDYPLHYACCYGASLKVIKYLVEEADVDKGKELLGKADKAGMYPLHQACRDGASIEVIKYLVEEADGDKGKEVLCKADQYGKYPLDLLEGASREDVIKYLIQKNPGPLQIKDDSPFINSVKYFFGMECQSTIWNETDEVVYVIVTDRTMETVNTNATSANIAENTPGGSAGVTHTKKDNKGPTPPQMTPILPRDFHTFNLESKDYYLTYYTKDFASGRDVFHEVNLRMEGKNDYMINRHCLEHIVEREPRLAWEIFVLSVPVKVFNMDTTAPPAADDVGQGGSSQRGTDSPAAADVGQGGSSQGGADSSMGGAGQGGEGQGEGDDTSSNNNRGDDTSGNNNNGGDDTSGSGNNNRGWWSRIKKSVGISKSTIIWNNTDKEVYVIVTDRTIGTAITTSGKMSDTIAGITLPVGFNRTNQNNMGPTPPQLTPIEPHDSEKFNLENKDYYLTYYTKRQTSENGEESTYLDYHKINILWRGKNDYKIYPKYLRKSFFSVKEGLPLTTMLRLVTPMPVGDTSAPQPVPVPVGDASAPQQVPVPVGDTRAAMRALWALVLGGICGHLLLFMLLLWLWVTMGPDEKEL